MPRIPIPIAHYPRNDEDLATLDERLGGRTSLVIGPRPRRADGTPGQPAFIEWWIEYERERPPTNRDARLAPANPVARDFLRALARRSASAWVSQAARARGR